MKKYIYFIFIVLYSQTLFAQQSGLKLLEIGPTATELSRSETSLGTPNGSSSMFTNPAQLINNISSSINLGYSSWISDSNNLFGGINMIKGKRALAFSFYTSGVTGLEQRNAPGESNGDFSIQYLAISGAYAYDFNYFSAGITGSYLNEQIFPFRATGYSINFGLASSALDNRIRFGYSLLNVGEMEKLNQVSTDLPTTSNFGVAVDVLEFTHKKNPGLPILVTLMTDFIMPFKNSSNTNFTDYNPSENYLNFAVSLEIADVVQINTGYKTGENTRPISFGVGLLTEKIIFNYALIPFNTGFGTVHSIGIQYQL